ncbi:MFS transporter [Kitasatospora sp. NPDC050463]|uniref:MFS transporter n=1 Tax=Kitasatospora sp. NPDC050463 TaxID=3155786 RepID=UPI0033F706B6
MSEAIETPGRAVPPHRRSGASARRPGTGGPGTSGPGAAALGSVCLGFFMVLLDGSALNVALPDLSAEFGGSLASLEWTVNAYTVAMAACLLGGGALADKLGARRLFQASLLLFVAASAACAAGPTIGALIAARVVQGVAAGGLLPASLAVIAHMYPESAARARAFTVWGGISSLALVAGPVVGGALTAGVGWRAIFLVNVPVGLAAALVCRRKVAPSPVRAARLDVLGQLATAALVGSGIGTLVQAGVLGWSAPLTLVLAAATLVASLAFVAVERGAAHPVLPLDTFRRPGFTPALTVGALYQFGAYGAQFAISLHLQHQWGRDALGAGLAFVPFALCWSLASFVLARAVHRIGVRALLTAGAATAAAGALTLLPLAAAPEWWLFTAGSCLLGLGAGLMGPSLPTLALRALPPDRSGLASGSLNAFRQIGGAVAIALFGPILAATGAGGLRVCLALVAAGFLAVTWAVHRSVR